MGTVTTTTSATITAFGNQRKLERTSNGVLWWIGAAQATSWPAAYSTDNGATWTAASFPNATGSGATTYVPNLSSKMDEDDYLNVTFKDNGDGYIYYRRGTPNAARTAYTWSAATTLLAATAFDYPDIVAHRDPANAGAWVAHVVWGRTGNTSIDKVDYVRLTIAANGTVTVGTVQDIGANLAASTTAPAYPSIDFNHTGDGKTVAGGTPHLYVGWSAGATGSGYGIRFRKATYASGSWTWGTEREIDNTHFMQATNPAGQQWLNCLFDGARVIIAGQVATSSDQDIILHDREAADPVSGGTTLRTISSAVAAGTPANSLSFGSASYDALGNVLVFGTESVNASGSRVMGYRRWVRATGTLEAKSNLDTTVGLPYVSARRGPQGQAIDYVYTDGTASPYTVTSGRIVLNQNPTAPTPLTPADNATWDSATDQTVTFRHNDPDGDPASAYAVWFRPAGTSVPYQALTGTTTVPNGGTITHTIPANTWPGVIAWYATTTDPSGAVSPPSAIRTVTGTPAALAGATGGGGGTAFSALALYSATEVERVNRVATRSLLTTVTAVSPLTITVDGGPVTAQRNAGYTPTVGDTVQAEYVSGQWIIQDKVV